MIIRTLLVASALALASANAYAQNRNINLEPECADTGSGMDPRCVGDTEPGTISDMTTARQERAVEGAAAAQVRVARPYAPEAMPDGAY